MRPLYMLDTSACIQVLRGQAPFDALPACKDTAVSSLVAAELWTGVEKSDKPNKAAALETFLNLFTLIFQPRGGRWFQLPMISHSISSKQPNKAPELRRT